jgi:hypothetical protein
MQGSAKGGAADPSGGMADLGQRYVAAIVAHDWMGVASCFEPDARFHAVTPTEKRPYREHIGGAAIADQIRAWFGDADVTELVESTVEPLLDVVAIRYRVHEHEPGGWYLVEQVAYATPGTRAFRSMDLLCSGFRSVAH